MNMNRKQPENDKWIGFSCGHAYPLSSDCNEALESPCPRCFRWAPPEAWPSASDEDAEILEEAL